MPSRRVELLVRGVRWFLPTALLALAPKCLLCAAAYVGLGAALGLGGPELCGATNTPAAWTSSLAWLGVIGVLGTVVSLMMGRIGRRQKFGRTVER
jgi:hypothetical protein